MWLVRGNPPSAGQISVGASAHLCRIPTAGNIVKHIDRVNGSATRLPRQCDLSVESRLLPDKVVFDVTCPWEPTSCRTSCILMWLVRGTLPSAGQISVGDPAHLRRLPTAGNSEKLIDRVNGSATRLPPWGLAALGTRGRRLRSRRAWSSRGLLVAGRDCFREAWLARKTEQPALGLTVESIDS